MEHMIKTTVDTFGGVDILVNAAGVPGLENLALS